MINYSKIRIAEMVLKAVSRLSKEGELDVSMYSDGRRQGYCLTNHEFNTTVAFSEYRSGNALDCNRIVVFCGRSQIDFSMLGNVPSKDAYDNRTFFLVEDIEGAAEFIIEYLSKSSLMQENAMIDHSDIEIAEKVLEAVSDLNRNLNSSRNLCTSMYSDGKEQGYCLTNYENSCKVVFRKDRVNNCIVVDPLNPVNQDQFYFLVEDVKGAAKFIIEFLTQSQSYKRRIS